MAEINKAEIDPGVMSETAQMSFAEWVSQNLSGDHTKYLNNKFDAVRFMLADTKRSALRQPNITAEKIKVAKRAIKDSPHRQPYELSFLEYYISYHPTIKQNRGDKDTYTYYLEQQQKQIGPLLEQISNKLDPKTTQIASTEKQQNTIPQPETKEPNRSHRHLLLSVIGIFAIAGAFAAHQFLFAQSQIDEATLAIQRDMGLPALSTPIDTTPTYMSSPPPTPIDLEIFPTPTGSVEGGNDNPPFKYKSILENTPNWNKDATPFDAFGSKPSEGGSMILFSNGETQLVKAGSSGRPGNSGVEEQEDNLIYPLGILTHTHVNGQQYWRILPINQELFKFGFKEISIVKDLNTGGPTAAIVYNVDINPDLSEEKLEQKIARYSSDKWIKLQKKDDWEQLKKLYPELAPWVVDATYAAEKGSLYYQYGVDSSQAEVHIPGT